MKLVTMHARENFRYLTLIYLFMYLGMKSDSLFKDKMLM